MKKNLFPPLLSLVFICCFSLSYAENKPNKSKSLDNIVAIVNEDVITSTELDKKVNLIKKQLVSQGVTLPPLKDIKKQVLNTMVLDALQLQIAKLNNMLATPEQVNAAIETVAKQNNLTVLTFRKKLEADGINYETFKKDIINQLTIMSLQQAIASSEVKITSREIEQEIERLDNNSAKSSYRISHILIAVPNSPDSNKIQLAKQRANQIMQELNKKKFSEVAMIASDGQQALKGGDLGWYNFADLPELFAKIVPKLKKDEVHGPIQDESGFHIIKLADVKSDSKKYQEMQYKVSHILIKNDDITTDLIAKKELDKIKADITKHNNFADLALIYSEDVNSASKGGSLGWISNYSVQPEFGHVVKSLKINEISTPFKTAYGWHIVKLEDKKIIDNTESWKKMQAKQIIENRKFQDALASWQNKIKSESMIEILI
ncbi:MAG: peptidylprolyl isomerase [Gammaproteobacteria bacterium]|nr:peptidylprolyl isomerase [Gammaproteobacteria bacterium]